MIVNRKTHRVELQHETLVEQQMLVQYELAELGQLVKAEQFHRLAYLLLDCVQL